MRSVLVWLSRAFGFVTSGGGAGEGLASPSDLSRLPYHTPRRGHRIVLSSDYTAVHDIYRTAVCAWVLGVCLGIGVTVLISEFCAVLCRLWHTVLRGSSSARPERGPGDRQGPGPGSRGWARGGGHTTGASSGGNVVTRRSGARRGLCTLYLYSCTYTQVTTRDTTLSTANETDPRH